MKNSSDQSAAPSESASFDQFMAAAREAHRLHFSHINMRESDWAAFAERNRRARPRLRPGAQALEIEVRYSRDVVGWEPVNMGHGEVLESRGRFSDQYHAVSAEASAMGGKNSAKRKKKSIW